mmetsp:Transcript_108891/g.347620  ORF Transcript_108891/g.347620 Transcript_108891/m.347620 type:complete len:218 (-) Transcript_108891:158-811(-)
MASLRPASRSSTRRLPCTTARSSSARTISKVLATLRWVPRCSSTSARTTAAWAPRRSCRWGPPRRAPVRARVARTTARVSARLRRKAARGQLRPWVPLGARPSMLRRPRVHLGARPSTPAQKALRAGPTRALTRARGRAGSTRAWARAERTARMATRARATCCRGPGSRRRSSLAPSTLGKASTAGSSPRRRSATKRPPSTRARSSSARTTWSARRH